ncbi:MAG: DJ-1/PfpI family protein [Candidatus Micrarchaeota archaeon]|nr:DJ-1/PfpI family protein [Candidatus Micrarchaeota archaeon]
MKKILLPLADGFEEIEAISVMDVLRRAGFDVIVTGLPSSIVEGAHGLKIIADKKIDNVNMDEFDALVLPGGNPGYKNLGKSKKIMDAICAFEESGKLVAAICASPTLLAEAGILKERKATVYPGMEREIPRPRDGNVVVDDNVITSKGPGTAIEFALKIVEILDGKENADILKRKLCA